MMRRSVALAVAPAAQAPVSLNVTPRPMLSPPFVDGDGRNLTLEAFRGRVVLLNIWATWCPPCREEMPALDRLEARLGGGDFHVLALSIDESMDAVRQFYADLDIGRLQPYRADRLRAMLAFGVVGFPTTILIDRAGLERGRRVGPATWNGLAAVRQIQTLIPERTTDQ